MRQQNRVQRLHDRRPARRTHGSGREGETGAGGDGIPADRCDAGVWEYRFGDDRGVASLVHRGRGRQLCSVYLEAVGKLKLI